MLEAQFVGCGVSAHVCATREERKIMFAREFGDEALVGVGLFAAQLVIEVCDDEDDAEFGTQFDQNAQQRDGISSAGNGHSYAVAGFQQLAFADVVKHLIAQELMVPLRVAAIKKRLPPIYTDEHGFWLKFWQFEFYPCNPC